MNSVLSQCIIALSYHLISINHGKRSIHYSNTPVLHLTLMISKLVVVSYLIPRLPISDYRILFRHHFGPFLVHPVGEIACVKVITRDDWVDVT